MSKLKIKKILLLILFLSMLSACKRKENNIITYYNKVNEIDSIYKIANNPKLAIKEYSELFRKYPPKNHERIEEYKTYIKLADKYNVDFGGKPSLYKLISLIAPYKSKYKECLPIFKKYGIDSIEVNKNIENWKKKLNKRLIDSFSIAMVRDQEQRHINMQVQAKNVKKNAELLIWTFKNYGFPSVEKIGTTGNNGVLFIMPTFLTHMMESKEYYPFIKAKLFEYVKSGDCLPRDYAMMVDMYNASYGKETFYGFSSIEDIKDSMQINRNRKSIGLPSLAHYSQIKESFDDKK